MHRMENVSMQNLRLPRKALLVYSRNGRAVKVNPSFPIHSTGDEHYAGFL